MANEILSQLGKRLPQIALGILAARQGGPQAAAAFQAGMLERQQREEARTRQTQLDEERRQAQAAQESRQAGADSRAASAEARAAEDQKLQRVNSLMTALSQYDADPSALASMYGVPPEQATAVAAPIVTARDKKKANDLLADLERSPLYKGYFQSPETLAELDEQSIVWKGSPIKIRDLRQIAEQTVTPKAVTAPPQRQNYLSNTKILADVPLDRQHAAAVAAGDIDLAKQIEQAMTQQDATRRDPPRQPIQITVGDSGLTQPQLTTAAGLRDDFRTESKDFYASRDGYERMLSAATDPTPAGDVALLYGFMKLLDPNSVVRETEFATAAKTGSLPQQIQATAERVVNGQRLTSEQRNDFISRAKGLFGRAQNRQNVRRTNYQRIARQSGVPADLVVQDEPPVDESVIPTTPAAVSAPGPNPYRGRASGPGR